MSHPAERAWTIGNCSAFAARAVGPILAQANDTQSASSTVNESCRPSKDSFKSLDSYAPAYLKPEVLILYYSPDRSASKVTPPSQYVPAEGSYFKISGMKRQSLRRFKHSVAMPTVHKSLFVSFGFIYKFTQLPIPTKSNNILITKQIID